MMEGIAFTSRDFEKLNENRNINSEYSLKTNTGKGYREGTDEELLARAKKNISDIKEKNDHSHVRS